MQRLRLSVWRSWGGASLLALASGCGLVTEGAELFDLIDEGDASVDELRDAGAARDAASSSKDAGADSGSQLVDDAGDASTEDASGDAEADADDGDIEDASPDGSDDLDATAPPDDADAEEPLPEAGDPGPPDSGSSCCEGDPNVFPGQTAFFKVPNKCGNFDYDCDGNEEKELGRGKACSRPFIGNSCDAHTEGFKDTVPECGEPGIKFTGCTGRTWNGGCNSIEQAVIQACR